MSPWNNIRHPKISTSYSPFCRRVRDQRVLQRGIDSQGKLEMMRRIQQYNSHNLPLKRGAWSPEEDQKLIAYINRHGIWNWIEIPKAAGLLRSGKSCRLRWMNYLRPDIKRGNFSMEEVETILMLHQKIGNRRCAIFKDKALDLKRTEIIPVDAPAIWSAIAAKLPGRTDNEIKNFWNTNLKKNYLKNSINIAVQAPDNPQETQTSKVESKKRKLPEIDVPLPTAPKILKSEESDGSPKLPTANFSSSFNLVNDLIINENQTIEDKVGLLELTGEQCFWCQPFSTEGQKCKVEDYGDTPTVEMWVQELLHGDACTGL
ncbi:unnamed protein product [Dovyalis caffra]|uniref:Uncharacterized protein n=1 Tax=Dovyalis caffra TaxID=77055 RepID=A0AAV1SHS6_9ROSI|nr:unnamed protein product [Dovyalis caffra]